MNLILAMTLAVTLAGCTTSGIIGGGKPTTIECEGKATIMYGGAPAHIDCPQKFKLKINVQ